MQMLAAGGLAPLTDNRRPADPSNPRGYFEFEPVTRTRVDRRWLAQARGHAVKIIHLLLPQLPTHAGFNYRVIIMRRPIDEVVASQRVMLERQGRPSVDGSVLGNVYMQQLSQVEQWLTRQACFRSVSVDYHELLRRPADIARDINVFLETHLDIDAMAMEVDPALCHHHNNAIRA